MDPKIPRPAASGGANRAGTSKGLGGTFDPQFSFETNGPQDSVVPIALTRIVIGRRYSFLYIRNCPLSRAWRGKRPVGCFSRVPRSSLRPVKK